MTNFRYHRIQQGDIHGATDRVDRLHLIVNLAPEIDEALPGWIVAMNPGNPAADVPVLACFDCDSAASAKALYESDLPGCCDACATAFFACGDCEDEHHPDDPCEG